MGYFLIPWAILACLKSFTFAKPMEGGTNERLDHRT